MKYTHKGFKLIHWDKDDFDKLTPAIVCNPEVVLDIEYFDVYDGQLPIIFKWKFAIFHEEKLVFSFVTQEKYFLKFEKNNSVLELQDLIDHAHMIFSMEWVSNTNNTIMEGIRVHMLPLADRISAAKEIWNVAGNLLLIDV